ncbi:DUF1376 domain-containing protein [Allopusillimonas ginsengisoli]|uniref:DUF1376 domain-containing protein n=1 Tax=Allopusillimonas ginsengisoli TaxID=453575 RepID=UPI0039C1723A
MSEPLTPPDCDLRGMDFIPFEVQYWRDSNLSLYATDEEFRAGITLVWASWHQVPAASIPSDDQALMALCGLGRKASLEDWLRIKDGALRDWVLCDDGRYYHRQIAQSALKAWAARTRYRATPTDGNAARGNATPKSNTERLQRFRFEHKTLRNALKAHYGIHVAYNASISEVQATIATARTRNPEIAVAEKPSTESALAEWDVHQAGVMVPANRLATTETRTPETEIRFSPETPFAETAVTGQQEVVIGREREIVQEELLLLQGEKTETRNGNSNGNGAIGVSADVGTPHGHPSLDMVPDDEDADGGFLVPLDPSRPKRQRALSCPINELVRLYLDKMPSNPRIQHVTTKRRRLITQGWQEASKIEAAPFCRYQTVQEGLQAWADFFETCAESSFLTGKAPPREPGKPPFMADIEFLMKPDNIVKCLENKYHRGN